jgi:chemotaxis protein MotB
MSETKKKKKSEAPGAPAWMVTYSDMVTLLLTFFVLLLSMASMDKIKFSSAAGSLRGAFGVLGSTEKTPLSKPRVVEFAPIEDETFHRLYQKIQTSITHLKLDRDIELVKDRGAVVLRVKASILFAPGAAQVKAEAYPVLRKVADLVRPLPLNLRIEGNTDDLPLNDPALSNWDLSVNRAVGVLKFFAGEGLLPLRRMSALGYGAENPLAPNGTAEERALNRRVDFVLESIGSYRESLPYLIDANDQYPF